MIEGQLIVIEGVDGAGTTTQAARLAKRLGGRGLPVHTTREPSDGPIGALLRQILTGRVVVPGMRGVKSPSWQTMALLFAADRMDHCEAEIVPNLMDGVTVISDRYDHSSVAYQSISGGGELANVDWVRTLNRHARRPDLIVVLDVPVEIAGQRRDARGGPPEMYEDDEMQEQLTAFYANLEQHFPGDNIVHVDGAQVVDEVAAAVMHQVRVLRNEA